MAESILPSRSREVERDEDERLSTALFAGWMHGQEVWAGSVLDRPWPEYEEPQDQWQQSPARRKCCSKLRKKLGLSEATSGIHLDEFQAGVDPEQELMRQFRCVLDRLANA